MRKLNKNLSYIALDNIFNKVVNAGYFFLIALLISKEELGFYSWLIAITSFSVGLLTAGIGKVISRRIAVNTSEFEAIVSSVIRLYIYGSVILLIIASAIYLFFQNELFKYVLLGVLVVTSSILFTLFRESFIGLEKFIENSKISLFNIIFRICIGIAGIYFFKQHISILLLALIFSNIASIAIYIHNINRQKIKMFVNKTNTNLIESVFKEGLPLLGVILFDSALSRFDTFFLGSTGSMSTTGEYNIAYKVYELCWFPFVIIASYVYPKISRLFQTSELSKLYEIKVKTIMKLLINVSLFLPFIICLAWTPVVDWATQGKYGANNQEILEILCLVIPFVSVIGIQWNILIASKKGKVILLITSITAILNILLNIYLIESFGAIGAAITNFASNFLQISLYAYVVSKISKKLGYIIFYIMRVVTIAGLTYYVIKYLDILIIIKSFLLLGFIGYLIFATRRNIISLNEK